MEKIKEIRMETIKNTNRITSLKSVTKNSRTTQKTTITKKVIA